MPEVDTCPYCGSDEITVKTTPVAKIYKCAECGYTEIIESKTE